MRPIAATRPTAPLVHEVVEGASELWASSDIVFKVRGPTSEEVGLMREGGTLIGFIWPAQNPELMQQLTAKKVTCWPSMRCRAC
jgi:NAD/NADP transhydrogenase alpha subunit